ncbi:hypothetical protein IW138_003110 [Coemansia sp. RSA 986]|nr:hypothetical protein IW138_003110 [Coemansia sp. RSA 986]
MRYKMLANAMDSITKEPYEALVDDFGRTCASNRRANREIGLLHEEIRELKECCAYLEAVTNLPPSAPPHRMSEQEHAVVDGLKQELEDARRALEIEISLNSRNGDLQKQLTCIESSAAMWHRTAMDSNNAGITSSNAKHGGENSRVVQNEQAAYGCDSDDLLVYCTRAETGTTTSETPTSRTPSDGSTGAGDHRCRVSSAHSPKLDAQEKARLESAIEVVMAEKDRLDKANVQLIDENEGLKDECDSLRQQLDDSHNEIQAHTGTALSAVSSLDLESDEDMGDSAVHYAEIAMLKVECKYSKQHAQILEEHVGGLTEELERSHEQLRQLCHDMVRPYLREATVAPTMAESVSEKTRQWSELKVVVPPANSNDRTTPTKSSEAGNNYQSGHGRFRSINSNATFSTITAFQMIKC